MESDDWLEREAEPMLTNWNEVDRMEFFGFDIEDLDIPSGSLVRGQRS